MPLTRGQVDVNGTILEAEPFEWPRSNWEVMEVRVTRGTGWATLGRSVLDTLNTLYNGATGSIESGLKGLIVQYNESTGPSAPFVVQDWRGNSGSFVFVPDVGFEVEEVHGSAEGADPLSGGYWTATIRLVKV